MAKVKLMHGERELARTPPSWIVWATVLMILGMPASLFLLDAFGFWAREHTAGPSYIVAGVSGFNLLILWPILRWRIMVTDRRVLIRRGFLKRQVEEIDRKSIRSVRSDALLIRIDAGDGIVETHCHPFFAQRIVSAIDPDGAARARSAGMLGGLLNTGEQVTLRPKSAWPNMLTAMAMVVIPYGLSNYWLVDDRADLDGADIWFLLLLPAALAVAAFLLATAVIRSQKRWLITGQRILTLQGVFRRRLEEVSLDRIEQTDFDGETMTVDGGVRGLDIPLGQVREDDLKRVLGRWFPWQGEVAGPIQSLLHDGETILLRHPRKWVSAIGIVGPFAFLLGLAAFMAWYLPEEGFDTRLVMTAVLPLVGFLFLLPQMSRELAWSVLLTDRRVLLRRRHDHSRYDSLPLDAIEDIGEGDKDNPRVVLRGQDRSYVIRTTTAGTASLIRETVERARGEARWRA